MEEKSCRTCKHKFDESCPLPQKFNSGNGVSIKDKIECKLEDGIIDDILRESLDIKSLFQHMQEEGFIKKNVDTNKLAQDDTILNLLIEEISDKAWMHIIKKVSNIDNELIIKMADGGSDDFYCSYWM